MSEDSDQQRVEWERFVRMQHATGVCEFSGLAATSCIRSICDCFETEENAKAMARGECSCSACRMSLPATSGGDTTSSGHALEHSEHTAHEVQLFETVRRGGCEGDSLPTSELGADPLDVGTGEQVGHSRSVVVPPGQADPS